MDLINLPEGVLDKNDGVFSYKNKNTTIGFVRFNNAGEVEYIFVNPFFRKKKIAENLLKLVKKKNTKKTCFSKTYKPTWLKVIKIYRKMELKFIFFTFSLNT
tara:strand:+ start:19 stop:324 length:306 start_codon:yes stop_codon:yes gene_type:complete